MSDFADLPLLDLFKDEARSQVQALETGLVELEQSPTNPQLIEPLMRAAHSIKGAARVVGVDVAVGLAHVMEECLVRAQRGTVTLVPSTIDALLSGSDLLLQIAEAAGDGMAAWLEANQPRLEAMTRTFEDINEGRTTEAAEPTSVVAPIESTNSSSLIDNADQPEPVASTLSPSIDDGHKSNVAHGLEAHATNQHSVAATFSGGTGDKMSLVPEPVAPLDEPVPKVLPTIELTAAEIAETECAPSLPDDSPLVQFFQMEATTQCTVLRQGLPELGARVRDVEFVQRLLTATQALSGSARIVLLSQVGELAMAIGQTVTSIKKGKLSATTYLPQLRQAVELIAHAAVRVDGFDAAHRQSALRMAKLLLALAPGDGNEGPALARPMVSSEQRVASDSGSIREKPSIPDESRQVASRLMPVASPQPVAQEASAPLPIARAEQETKAPLVLKNTIEQTAAATQTAPKSAVIGTPPTKPSGSDEKERVVRITAQSLTRLMGLAGESLVEARWLQPFAQSLLMLRRQQDHLADVVEELAAQLASSSSSRRQLDLIQEARQQIGHCRQVLNDRIDEFETHARQSDDLNSRLYHEVITSRMRPFGDGVHGFPRMVRDLARQLGKNVHFEIVGQRTNVDREVLEKLEAPLTHLIRNAVDHGLDTPEERTSAGKSEQGRLIVEARHASGMLSITVTDDGRGVDLERLKRKIIERKLQTADIVRSMSEQELLDFLFLPGFSTAEKVTDVSGRGVGLDVVHSTIYSIGGSLKITTKKGLGTTFHLMLPITLSVLRAVLCQIAGEPYAFPHNRIDRLIKLPRRAVKSLEYRQYFEVDGRNVGLVQARQVLHLEAAEPDDDELSVVLFGNESKQYGLIVDAFRSEQDLVVRPLDPRLGKVPNISAAAILDDGAPVLIVDIEDLTRSLEKLLHGERLRRIGQKTANDEQRRKRVLVVDDSITVREVEKQLLMSRGYDVEVAVDGVDGWNVIRDGQFDLVVSDIDMPRMNGFDFVTHIKSDARLQGIPVIIVSYKDREEDKLRGLQAGANYYLTKSSFHDESLITAVEELIGIGMTV